MKIIIVSSSSSLETSRAKSLTQGFGSIEGNELIYLDTNKDGLFKYFELFRKTLKIRFMDKPDLYVINFNGYRIMPIIVLFAGKTPIVFDEFINPIEWLIYENHLWNPHSTGPRLLRAFYQRMVRRCRFVLSDTQAHAEYSAMLNDLSLESYIDVPIGVDEKIFHQAKTARNRTLSNAKFKVFYNAEPTRHSHGFSYVLSAAVMLSAARQVELVITSNSAAVSRDIKKAKNLGARIREIKAEDLSAVAGEINKADLCIGGPFGATIQAKMIITEKTYQSLACAKPTIIGKTKNNKFFIDKKNCLIVDQGGAKELADKIAWAFKNKKKLDKIGETGYDVYSTKLSNAVIKNRCSLILKSIR